MEETVLKFVEKNNGSLRVELQKEFGDSVKRIISSLQSKGLVKVHFIGPERSPTITITILGRMKLSPTFCEVCGCDPCDCNWGN